MFCFVLFSNCVSGVSTTGPLGMGSTTTSTTLRTTTWNIGRSTTPSLPGRRNRSTSTPSPAVEVLDDITTHLPSAASQIPAMEESCDAVEAREIMWFKTRQGQVAKQPCPAGTIGEPAPASLAQACLEFVLIFFFSSFFLFSSFLLVLFIMLLPSIFPY